MADEFELRCWVLGSGTNRVFPVRIASSKMVGDLKKEIKKEKEHTFQDFDADALDLYKTSVAGKDIRTGLAAIGVDHFKAADELDGSDPLLQVFPDSLPNGQVYVVVVQPPNVTTAYPRTQIRLDTMESPPAASPFTSPFTNIHRQYWGNPLDSALTTLPTPAMDLSGLELDDVLSGDPFLNAHKIHFLVRAEYIRTFDKVKEAYNKYRHDHLAVVTGQPGIGKTFWILYALCRCLGEKQPVIYYQANKFIFFSETGVETIDPQSFRHPPYTWCLVDSTAADPLPDLIYTPFSELFPVYVTSPKEARWAKLHQLRLPELIIMNPWTRAELEKAAILYPERTSEDISERFENAGPSARLCLQYTPIEISQFYDTRDAKIWDTPKRLVATLIDEDEQRLRIGDISHQLCVVRRSAPGLFPFAVEPISAFMRNRLLAQLWEWEEQDRDDMIKRFSRVPGASGMTGVVFESQCQHRFAKKIDIVAAPMFRTADSRWHAAFGDFSASLMLQEAQKKALSIKPSPIPISLSISPSALRVYKHSGPLAIEENIYYVPLAENEVAIDSFIVHDGHLYLFQFASGAQHSVNRGLLNTLSRFSGLPVSENQHFMFVVPKHRTQFNCPHSSDGFLHDHVPYVAQIDN